MSGECDKCSEHAVDCKCINDDTPQLGCNRILLETPMPDTILKRFSLEIQNSNECPNCFDEHPENVACNPWRRKHPITECRVCHEMECKCQATKLFMGLNNCAKRGYQEFKGNFIGIQNACIYAEKLNDIQYEWAQLVINDAIVVEGIQHNNAWTWTNTDKSSTVANDK